MINVLKYLNGNLILDFQYASEVQNLELKMIPRNEKVNMNQNERIRLAGEKRFRNRYFDALQSQFLISSICKLDKCSQSLINCSYP